MLEVRQRLFYFRVMVKEQTIGKRKAAQRAVVRAFRFLVRITLKRSIPVFVGIIALKSSSLVVPR
jgi:hypothetical protein